MGKRRRPLGSARRPTACVAILALCAGLSWTRSAAASPVVWAIDDGEKIKEDDVSPRLRDGTDNPVWSPGQPIRLFALKNESVAVQVVVAADDAPLDGVTVDLDELTSTDAPASPLRNEPGAKDPTSYAGRPIERFREHFFDIKRASGGKNKGSSLHWAKGSGPPPERWVGRVPDGLIPVEVAPSWSPYPLAIAAKTNGIVWIDITIPKAQPKGLYRGTIVVKASGRELATLPIELDVLDATLPDRPLKTMLFYQEENVAKRIGHGPAAEQHLWRLLHRHRIQPLHGATSVADVERHLSALDGSAFTRANGYEGPGEGAGDGVLSLGTYGSFGEPNAAKLATVEQIADYLAGKSLLATTDTFIYAIDEECSSPFGRQWKTLMGGSKNPNAKRVRVGWTCSENAVEQPVDIPMMAKFDPDEANRAKAVGKEVWIYNGHQPQTATFSTDAPAISTRVNGWIQGLFGIERWFFWESVFWYDGNRGGKGPYDPFITSETFHNADGDYGMGDGVLLYPGKQTDMFQNHSVGFDGVIASIRLKNWRRGIEDAGYLTLARAINKDKADAVAKGLLPVVVSAAEDGQPPSWSDSGKAYFEARKVLAAIITHRDGNITVAPPIIPPKRPTSGCSRRGCGSCATMATATNDPSASTMSVDAVVIALATFFAARRSRRDHIAASR